MLVGALVESGERAPAGGGEARDADSAVGRARRELDQPARLERAQHPARVARVEAEAGAQEAHLAALAPDLPEDARLAQRAVEAEEVVAERPEALGHRAVEVANLVDRRRGHSLTLVRELREVKTVTAG